MKNVKYHKLLRFFKQLFKIKINSQKTNLKDWKISWKKDLNWEKTLSFAFKSIEEIISFKWKKKVLRKYKKF